MTSVILIGPLPPPIGGATVLFQQLIACLDESKELQVQVINTAGLPRGRFSRVKRGISCSLKIIGSLRRAELLSFHASLRGIVIFAPFLRLICALWRRPLVLRVFGGGLADWYRSAGAIRRAIFRMGVLGADVIFLERQASVGEFSKIARGRVEWMPNSRPIVRGLQSDLEPSDVVRFVFLAHVKPSKGIGELLEASKKLPPGKFLIDVYGPLTDGIVEDSFSGADVNYRGVVSPSDVHAALCRYDVLVLPTYYEGEGHPGVIIEAYGAGLAVISTEWAGIPEIVVNDEGILVQPRDVVALARAMSFLIDNPTRVVHMKRSARCRALDFDSAFWAAEFADVCNDTAARRIAKINLG
jgi:glycosyltransferase involved in cell wall biosynthesis